MAGVTVASLVSPAATGTPTANPIDSQVDAAHDDLAEANAQVKEVTQELAAAQAQLEPAQAKLSVAQTEATRANSVAQQAQAQLAAARAQLAKVQADVAKVEAEIGDIRGQIATLARMVYTAGGPFNEVQILLDSRDPAEFTERLASIQRVSRGNSETFTQLAAAQASLSQKLEQSKQLRAIEASKELEASARAADAERALNDAASAKQTVDQLVAQRAAIVAKADSQRDAVRRQYNELKAEQERIKAAIKAAQEAERARQREKEKNKQQNGGDSGSSKSPNSKPPASKPPAEVITGELGWPLPGYRAGGRTGPRVHPIYGYRSCHTGDDIGAPSGTAIKSAADGTVISTSSGGPYGNNTLISHGNGLVTMYAHQSRFGVKKGDKVSRGQTIGYVGSTGYSTGPHLHFEVHVNGVPWEPMGWFGESKHRVTCA